MDKKKLLDALLEIHGVLLFGNQYAEDEGIDIDFNFDLLTNYIEGNTVSDYDAFEMTADVCAAIRNLANAYGGDSHFNNCVLVALRSCISALEGLNK